MNKKGSVVIYGMMLAVTIIILAMALAPSVVQFTDTARNQTVGDEVGLDCNNVSISNFDKATCVVTDITPFYFIFGLILIAGGIVAAKVIFD